MSSADVAKDLRRFVLAAGRGTQARRIEVKLGTEIEHRWLSFHLL